MKLREVEQRTPLLAPDEARGLGLRASPRRTSGGELVYELSPQTLLSLDTAEALEQRVSEIVGSLRARGDVEYAQQNWILTAHVEPNDTHYDKQWHYWTNGTGSGASEGGINLPIAWDETTGDRAVRVAVLDTGILPAHADIAASGNLISGYDMITDVSIANDGDGRDADPTDPGDAVAADECYPGSPQRGDSWHGTHVSGTIGAVATDNASGVAGGNWMVSIQPVRVLGKCGGTTVDINDAMRWAAGLAVPGVPANQTPADVINLSLGGGVPCSNSPATQQAIDDVVSAGVVVVVSAGNSAADAAGFTPASCNGVITVAASDARGHLASRYSNFGPSVEIMAPGGDVTRDDNNDGFADGVLSTVKGGYGFYNGTSMAAPHVSAVSALLLAGESGLGPNEVLQRIQGNALSRTPSQCPDDCGAGLLNAHFPDEGAGDHWGYEYAAKFVCGERTDVARANAIHYDTIVNIRNPGSEKVTLRKRLELAMPPGNQQAGETAELAEEVLPRRTTIAADCHDIVRRVFGGTLPAPHIDGYLVIEAMSSLDVTALYQGSVVAEERVSAVNLEVERVWERTRNEE
ncbi:S8 family peptidase [Arhodomonas sp. SL1]|uniref:S8 family peptidase n=1 Tax=Arhodomonas sp. SL1 TaxID=3425691 RepID=UPI003F881F28